ncbi:hypothetical protein [Yinghuangia soli]|uniref:Uncharacterized protein n=1 Tax=Yinghuangia soli TaxID=2908204 RepID=A0AA41Q7V5_9ACTN|nr:hypothetical protein [Yinghuangia soli]MCF2533208.1 hypothetical protein [Yinghuangia soli]
MADDGFKVDGPYLRTAAEELVQALTVARAIVARSTEPYGQLDADVGSIQLGMQLRNVWSTSGDTMKALVAKGEAVAVALIVAADKYDLAEAKAYEAMKYPAPLLPPSMRTTQPGATPPPFDMTKPIGSGNPAGPGGAG